MPDASSREYVLPADICDDFDEEILRKLDEICNKRTEFPIQVAAASIESPCRPCSTDSLHDSVVLQSGGPQDEFHVVEMRAPERPASFACSSATESVSVSSCVPHQFASAGGRLGGGTLIASDSTSDKMLVLGDEDLANSRDTQYSAVESITTVEGNPPTNSTLNPTSARVVTSSCGLSVAQPLIATASEKTICDTELPDYLKKLNESQREAALSDTLKPLLILAGPGSGKVRPWHTWACMITVPSVLI